MKTFLAPAAALLAACSHAEAPPRPPSSPTFESSLPPLEPVSEAAETDLCAELAAAGRLETADVPGGVALIAAPRPGRKLDDVLHATRDIHDAMTPDGNLTAQPGVPVVAPAETDRCALFDAARAGARADIDATPEAVRIVITSGDPAATVAIRENARRFVRDASSRIPP